MNRKKIPALRRIGTLFIETGLLRVEVAAGMVCITVSPHLPAPQAGLAKIAELAEALDATGFPYEKYVRDDPDDHTAKVIDTIIFRP